MAPAALVTRFYQDVWNRADTGAACALLAPDFRFRASLGPERVGPEGFIDYMLSVHAALGDYTCIIDDLVAQGDRAAARMTFRGTHRGTFFGVPATGRTLTWSGAAFFQTDGTRILSAWVLGDVDAVRRQLGAETGAGFG
jgi:steroid delta-isomerase-like uncharacterized protein